MDPVAQTLYFGYAGGQILLHSPLTGAPRGQLALPTAVSGLDAAVAKLVASCENGAVFFVECNLNRFVSGHDTQRRFWVIGCPLRPERTIYNYCYQRRWNAPHLRHKNRIISTSAVAPSQLARFPRSYGDTVGYISAYDMRLTSASLWQARHSDKSVSSITYHENGITNALVAKYARREGSPSTRSRNVDMASYQGAAE